MHTNETLNPEHLWQQALGELELQMTKATFDTWLANTRAIAFEGNTLTIGVPDGFARDWLDNRMLSTVERTLVGIIGQPVQVRFEVAPEALQPGPSALRRDSGQASLRAGSGQAQGKLRASSKQAPVAATDSLELQPVYLSARSAIVQPDKGIFVTLYSLQKWLPLLGYQRWSLVQMLRGLCTHLPVQPNGTRHIQVTWQQLAEMMNVDEKTIRRWLQHEPIPDDKPWRQLCDDETGPNYLRLFIPRLRYTSERVDGVTRRTGFMLEIVMEDPPTPEDERAYKLKVPQHGGDHFRPPDPSTEFIPSRVEGLGTRNVSGQNVQSHSSVNGQNAHSHSSTTGQNVQLHSDVNGQNVRSHIDVNGQIVQSQGCERAKYPHNVNELTVYTNKLNKTLTSRRAIRRAVKPVVRLTEEILDDYHSTAMLYKVLLVLYPDHLGLFTGAVEEAVVVGQEDPEANLGAVFVATLKELAAEAGVELGLGGA